MLESGIEFVYDNQNILIKSSQAVRSALKTGTGYLYVDWDPDKQSGEGEITVRNMPWRMVYLDPAANEIDEANYVIIRVPMNINDLKRRFPERADEIVAENKNELDFGRKFNDFKDPSRATTFINQRQQVSRFDSKDTVILEEFWIKDFSQEEIPEEVTAEEILEEQNQLINGINPDVGKHENHDAHLEAHEELKITLAATALQVSPSETNDRDWETSSGISS